MAVCFLPAYLGDSHLNTPASNLDDGKQPPFRVIRVYYIKRDSGIIVASLTLKRKNLMITRDDNDRRQRELSHVFRY